MCYDAIESRLAAESYAHRDEVVMSKKSDKRVVEEYLNHVLPLLISQV